MQIISWEEYVSVNSEQLTVNRGLALTVGVFDGVHLGHQALIHKICTPSPNQAPPTPYSLLPTPLLPTVVTFKQNPMSVIKPDTFTGDILSMEEKLNILETLGVKLTVLIDFSGDFSKMSGRDFIDLLLGSRPVELIALGSNFRCGHHLDTGVGEIESYAKARGVETWIASPVMDEGQLVSSSRIRQALAAGRVREAERLLGRSAESIVPYKEPNRR